MKNQKCKICGKEIELEECDKIMICYGTGHVTLKQYEERKAEREKQDD